MEWKDEYSLGIQEIDAQHKKLIDLFSGLESAINKQVKSLVIQFGVINVRNYADMHFQFEEALMRLYGYEEYESHKEEHRVLFSKLEELDRNPLGDVQENQVIEFLRSWLIDHMLASDRGYVNHILSGPPIVQSKTQVTKE